VRGLDSAMEVDELVLGDADAKGPNGVLTRNLIAIAWRDLGVGRAVARSKSFGCSGFRVAA